MPAIGLEKQALQSVVHDLTAASAVTPMMAQYLDVKAKHPGFLLFYRMGDFFELFFDDAVEAASALGIQLTKRGKHLGEDIPMCGVPVVRADEYLHKLIAKGFRVAIAEQLEDPEAAKKRGPKAVVKRDVVRLVTPGTLTEDALLTSTRNNFLTAIHKTGSATAPCYHLASVDLSTGEFLLHETSGVGLMGEILKLNPAEVLLTEGARADPAIKAALEVPKIAVAALSASCFTKAKGVRGLKDAFEVGALDGLGDFPDGALCACGALLHYVALTQMGARPQFQNPKQEHDNAHLVIDAATRASLELVRPKTDGAPTIFAAIDKTVTAGGARELMSRLLSPSADPTLINARLDAVAFLTDDWGFRERIRRELRAMPDMTRSLTRLGLKRGGPRDLGVVRDGLMACHQISEMLASLSTLPAELASLQAVLAKIPMAVRIELDAALVETPAPATRDGGFIAKGFDAHLDQCRSLGAETKVTLASLQAAYIERTGVKSLKIQYNQVFGYFIDVSAASAAVLNNVRHASFFRHKQTLANSMRFTTDELASLDACISAASQDALERELTLFDGLVERVVTESRVLSASAAAVARLDCYAGLAECAEAHGYVRPIVDGSRVFCVKSGRHPAVEQALARDGAAFAGNDCVLDGEGGMAPALLTLTGPNMAGKSTYLRQNALIAVLTQMGSFVPARSAHIGVVDRLFARIGASDDLARGRSTFMVEMAETAAILNQATPQSLAILDEIGRGTATFDGLSIAWAVLEHLHDATRCRALIATHYHELTRLAETLPRAANGRMAVKEWKNTLVFLHAIEAGAANRSYGVQAARLAGVPRTVVDRARQVLLQLENGEGPHGPVTLPTDMPLFDLRSERVSEAYHPILAAIGAADLDALSPRDALDFLYKLKRDL